jgi:MarR family transcriptional regulator for hemolysin
VPRNNAPGDMRLEDWPRYGDFYAAGSRGDLEFRLAQKLVRTSHLWTKTVDAKLRKGIGQSRVRWETMFAIAIAGEPITTSVIADRLGLQWPALVRVLEELERDGLIERQDNPADGRSRLISLSTKGEETVAAIQEAVDPRRHLAMQGFTDRELAQCTALLDKMFQALRDGG